jgi:uncharacterized protein (DUF2384 family)
MATAHPTGSDIKRLTKPALRTFFRIAQAWELNRSDQMALLGLTATSTYQNWKADSDGRLTPDALERISYVLGIFKALEILFPETHIADGWVKRPNTALPFNGRSPLDHMRHGKMQNLIEVRDYLDFHRGT